MKIELLIFVITGFLIYDTYHEGKFSQKILSGKKILDSYGLQTNIWMSPAHTMDDVTVDVLKELGFTTVTDGNTLFPFKTSGF